MGSSFRTIGMSGQHQKAGLLVWIIYITLVINNGEIISEKVSFKNKENLTNFQSNSSFNKEMTEKDKEDIKMLERIIADLTKKNTESELEGNDDEVSDISQNCNQSHPHSFVSNVYD